MTLTTVSILYLFALSQLTGSVLHDMHLVWFASLLAASPCGDVLSVDAILARRRGAQLPSSPSVAYAWPLVTARLLLGLVYFFPGAWKLFGSGWAWVASDNLRNQMYWKWYEHDWIPAVRIDGSPAMGHACAAAVVVFELSFVALAVAPKTRRVAAVGGLAFHFATQAIMRIGFFALWGAYVILFDWAWLEERPVQPHARPLGRAWPLAPVLLAAVLVQGARGQTQAWPFACYPTFQALAPAEIPDVVMTATFADGRTAPVPPFPKSQPEWAMAWALVGGRPNGPSPDALRAYWDRALRKRAVAAMAQGAQEVSFARGWFSVLPADRGLPARRQEPLGSITLR